MKRFNYIRGTLLTGLLALMALGFYSCDDDDDPYPIVYWVNALSTKYENPAVTDRNEDGVLNMRLWDDNTLEYAINIRNLKSDDELTTVGFYAGDVLTNSDHAILQLDNITFNGGLASGAVLLRQSLADSLLNMNNQIYINIHSIQQPDGLVRGQINTDIFYTSYITLSPGNEVPPLLDVATSGTATVRMTTERTGSNQTKIYYQVIVSDLPSGDELLSAGIYHGKTGETGEAYLSLYTSKDDFGTNQYTTVSYAIADSLYEEDSYVNVISQLHPDGLIRGQLKNDYKNPVLNVHR